MLPEIVAIAWLNLIVIGFLLGLGLTLAKAVYDAIVWVVARKG